jgi:hypothetical protein
VAAMVGIGIHVTLSQVDVGRMVMSEGWSRRGVPGTCDTAPGRAFLEVGFRPALRDLPYKEGLVPYPNAIHKI